MAVMSDTGDPDRKLESLQQLLETVKVWCPQADLKHVEKAFAMAEAAHSGQCRKSGEPYVSHPIEVAKIVAELRMDEDSVVAALLHDVVEDTSVTLEDVKKEFGAEVQHLVGGVTKLRLNVMPEASDRQRAAAETTRAAESLRKMLLAMAQDVRVMVIKLADRLHNMRTLDALAPEKRTRIANETLDVYAPLAARLGIWQVKWRLEDLSFKTLHPKEFQEISDLVAKTRNQREEELQEATRTLRRVMDERGLKSATITSRPKHLYSIFNKIVKQGVAFEEIYDLQAMRVIVDETPQCYLVLGICHELWLPMPGLFYDYIAMPKPNGYQSLHTKVIGPGGGALEVQIRTKAMHEIAEFGVATHYSYKEGKVKHETGGVDGLRRQLFDWSSDSATSSDFLRTVSTDLFSEQVFVFTPKGDVLDLPKDSTPLDFAFRVHTDLGLKTIGAKVNGVMVPLSTKLQNGDVVELVTRSNAQPSLDWLEFVSSAHAKSKLRTYFRRRNRTESALRGKEALEKGLRAAGIDPKQYLGEDRMNEVSKEFKHCENGQDVFARIGEGILSVQGAVEKIRGLVKEHQPGLLLKVKAHKVATTVEGGIDNVMYRRAKCCKPIPGEDVYGYVTRGRGIIIHGRSCPNALRLMETESERLVPLEWPSDGSLHPVDLKIISLNRQGLLMDVSLILGESKTNVSGMSVRTMSNHTAEIDLTVDVRDVPHLQAVMNKIGNLSDVISILRVMGS